MLQSKWFVLLASILAPPAGLALLWLRRGLRTWDKIIGSTVLAVWSVVYLMLFFGLRFPLDGRCMRPIPTFGSPNAHYAELEHSRVATTAAAAEPGAAEEKPASA